MSAYAQLAAQAQEQWFAGFKQLLAAQEQVWTAAKEGRSVAAELPTPAEVVENSFGFASRALELQKEYALRLVGAVTPKL
ncbi:MAG TPA: hypothetical protein VK009_04955 [Chloroflexota bacterium]|nr:hypothetical protein [Chloroflexota bacterium]